MLTRNCETKKVPLIFSGDFNIRVTVFGRNPRFYTKEAYYCAWIETIRDSIGGSIVHSELPYTFTIRRLRSNDSYLFHSTGRDLIKKLRSVFQKPVSFRIETVEDKPKSWIFYLENDI